MSPVWSNDRTWEESGENFPHPRTAQGQATLVGEQGGAVMPELSWPHESMKLIEDRGNRIFTQTCFVCCAWYVPGNSYL